MRSAVIGLSLLFALAFLAGCISMTNVKLEDKLKSTDLTVAKYADASDPNSVVCKEVEGDKPCWCMLCQNHTTFLSRIPLLSSIFGPSLKQGDCWFKECNYKSYNDVVTALANDNVESALFPRVLMFGAGPSFSSTALATRYCGYSLQIATKWMIGKNNLPPVPPSSSRAECWLDRDILPLYIYYTAGKTIDAQATQKIAERLDTDSKGNKVGPVMVTTELAFDGTDPVAVGKVKEQITELRKCKKCLVVLAIDVDTSKPDANKRRMDALAAIFGPPGSPTQAYSPNQAHKDVNIVGFGFRANDYPACNVETVVGDNYIFSRDVMRAYSKPTIWLYAGASEGKNADGKCTWDAAKVHRFYQNIFALQQGMASSGIVGVSFYEFVDGTGPLPCTQGEGCKFGLLNADGTQKHPQLNTWSTLCNTFGTVQVSRPPLIFSKNTFGYVCDIHKGDQMYDYVSREVNSNLGLKNDPVHIEDPKPGYSCGEICPSDNAMPNPGAYDEVAGKVFSSAQNCEKFPEIDLKADDLDVSAIFFKAMIEKESGFDPAVVSCVEEGNMECNPYGYTIPKLCQFAGRPDNCAHVLPQYGGGQACPSGMKPCAYGLAQCKDYPGGYYTSNYPTESFPQRTQFTADCGGNNYDPFNAGDSICCGLNVFRYDLEQAQTFLNPAHWAELSKCDNGLKEADRGWATYFIAASLYNGKNPGAVYSDFLSQRGSDCHGEQNFIRYLKSKGFDYAREVMTIYRSAVGVCDSECPT